MRGSYKFFKMSVEIVDKAKICRILVAKDEIYQNPVEQNRALLLGREGRNIPIVGQKSRNKSNTSTPVVL